MRPSRTAALLVLLSVLATAGCGRSGGPGAATVWVTKDEGRTVLVTRSVPAGLTAMQALERVATVETRRGGRFVQAIDGLEASASRRRGWFCFVNGVEASRGAAGYRLRDGDVEWWDYGSWGRRLRQRVVVGAFPEPFVHGYDGKVRAAAVRYERRTMRALAYALGSLVAAKSVAHASVPVPPAANEILVVPGRRIFTADLRTPGAGAGSPVVFRVSVDAGRELVKDPSRARYRYEGLR